MQKTQFLNVLEIFWLITLEQIVQRGCRICILGGVQNQARQSLDLTWPCLEKGLDHINSRCLFQPKSSCLYNFSRCPPPF